jgi:hypothetical protein
MNFCVKNSYEGDKNIRFYRSALDAYNEMDRRMGYGIQCEVLERHEWPREAAREYSALWAGSERPIGQSEESQMLGNQYLIEEI